MFEGEGADLAERGVFEREGAVCRRGCWCPGRGVLYAGLAKRGVFEEGGVADL